MVPSCWCEKLVQRLKANDLETLVQHLKFEAIYVAINVSTSQISSYIFWDQRINLSNFKDLYAGTNLLNSQILKAYMLGPTCQRLKFQRSIRWDQPVNVI